MIQVEEMQSEEAEKLLERVGYGHLACCQNDIPYIVPVHYVFEEGAVYIYTTEGHKYDIIRENPNVCMQVEDVSANDDWQSVIVMGKADQITERDEREKALALITKQNPTLTPAISVRWMDDWIRENREVIYRIEPVEITGRYSLKLHTKAAFARPRGTLNKIY